MSSIPFQFKAESSGWLIALGGFAAMFVPVYWWAANGIWQGEDQAHGALILMVAGWLFWEKRQTIFAAPAKPEPGAGWPIFALGLLIYVVGRVLGVSILALGAQLPVILGILLILGGWPVVRVAWFPAIYVIFMVPLPGMVVDAVTGPLKQWISAIVEGGLYSVGYPIARTGVTLSIGQYQLLVADACSGLHSMFSLSALGVLYMYIVGRRSRTHNSIMLASILPIAFAANIVRVMVLVLVTYHFGDAAGQGFLHGAAGMVLLMAALLILIALDAGLARVIKAVN
jgi:exosortase B